MGNAEVLTVGAVPTATVLLLTDSVVPREVMSSYHPPFEWVVRVNGELTNGGGAVSTGDTTRRFYGL